MIDSRTNPGWPIGAREVASGGIALFVAVSCFWSPASAQTEIYKCTDADGGVVFSQLPCAPLEPVEPEKTAAVEETETTAPESTKSEVLATEALQATAESEADRAACQKPIRDAIDAIDAEIRLEYTPAKAEQYKQQLLELTRKLRQC